MTDRPGFLVLVAQPTGQLQLFSAHYTEAAACLMFTRLKALLAGSGQRVFLAQVPDVEGIAEAGSILQASEPDGSVIPTVQAAPVQPPAGTIVPLPRRKTAAQFEEETRAMIDAMPHPDAVVTDTPDPGYVGAFS